MPFDWNALEQIGVPVTGLKIDEHRFVTVMPFARLERLVNNPMVASDPKFRQMSLQLQEYYDLHAEIQRAFDKGKRSNAADYADYVIRISEGDNGDTPTIDFYTPKQLTVVDGDTPDQKARLIWDHDLIAVPYDGETQLAARYIAAQKSGDTRKMPVVVTITHGKSVDFARQCFHDRNAFQRRAPVGIAMAMDTRDPMIGIVRDIEEKIPQAKGAIEWRARQMPQKSTDKIAAASFVRTAVLCFVQGIQGVQLDKCDIPEGLSKEALSQRAVIWFSRVIEKIGPYMKDRENFVASSPAIWAALGAMGKQLTDPTVKDVSTLSAMADSLIAKLNGVDWRKGDAWVGIAVKQTPKGFSFAGGSKDSGSVAFKALSDTEDANFTKIRSQSAATA